MHTIKPIEGEIYRKRWKELERLKAQQTWAQIPSHPKHSPRDRWDAPDHHFMNPWAFFLPGSMAAMAAMAAMIQAASWPEMTRPKASTDKHALQDACEAGHVLKPAETVGSSWGFSIQHGDF